MKMKKIFALVLSLLLVAGMLYGCGAKSNGSMAAPGGIRNESTSDKVSGSLMDGSTTAVDNQKLVRKIWLTVETEDMDTLLTGVGAQIEALGGYVESRNVNNGSQYSGRRYRSAEMTIRIPADQLNGFIQHVKDNANITNNRETTENITLSYVEVQSRITALQTEQTRLLELLAEAKDMGALLEIEKRLTEVRYQLETVTSQLRVYDNQVAYGTIYLTVSEVTEYTVTEEPTSVWERITTGLTENLKDLGAFFVDLFVALVVGLPYLVLIVVMVFAICLLVKRRKKHKKPNKKAEDTKE